MECLDWRDLLLFILDVLAGEEACVPGPSLHRPRRRKFEGRGHDQHGCDLEELSINAGFVGRKLGTEAWISS